MLKSNDWTGSRTWDWSTPLNDGAISVIVPAKTTQDVLDLCLAGLAAQDIDINLLEVVVVDHKSEIPLVVSGHGRDLRVRLVRLDSGDGPGAARSFGASLASGRVLLFLDVDVVPDASMVRHYASVPLANPSHVSLGFRDFIDPAQVVDSEITAAISTSQLHDYLRQRPAAEGQEWIDEYLKKTDELRSWRDDLWIVVVGAGVGVSRELYDYAGGFHDFQEHGVEDTEFGFRLYQSGAVIRPVREAVGYHIGLRTISRDRARINLRRSGLLANMIPHPRYRPPIKGRQWKVPGVLCQVQLDSETSLEDARNTIDDLLGQTISDIAVVVWGNTSEDTDLLMHEFHGETRIDFQPLNRDEAPGIPLSSPFTFRVKGGVRLGADTIHQLLVKADDSKLALISLVYESDEVTAEFWRTHALARLDFADAEERQSVLQVIAEEWEAASRYGVNYDAGVTQRKISGGRFVGVAR